MSNLKTKPEKSFTPGSLKSPEAGYPDPQRHAKDWSPPGHSGRHSDKGNTNKGAGAEHLPEASGERPEKCYSGSGDVGVGDGKSHSGQGQKSAKGSSGTGGYG